MHEPQANLGGLLSLALAQPSPSTATGRAHSKPKPHLCPALPSSRVLACSPAPSLSSSGLAPQWMGDLYKESRSLSLLRTDRRQRRLNTMELQNMPSRFPNLSCPLLPKVCTEQLSWPFLLVCTVPGRTADVQASPVPAANTRDQQRTEHG